MDYYKGPYYDDFGECPKCGGVIVHWKGNLFRCSDCFYEKQSDLLTVPRANSKRDYTQYKVNGVFAGGKGKTVYKVVKLYVDSHPDLSFVNLQIVFSDSKIKAGTKQIIRKWEEVKDWRRFSKQPLVLHDGQKVAISNQWGVNKNQGGKGANWAYFLDLARDLGIEVEPIS